MIRIIYQLCKIKLTGVVELISGYSVETSTGESSHIASIVCFSAITVSSIHRDLISLTKFILILIVSHNQDSVFIIIL